MKRIILLSLFLITTLVITGCSKEAEPKDTTITNDPTTYTIEFTNNQEKILAPFTPITLGAVTIYSSPFVLNETSLIFPNWEENNKISVINEPYPQTLIQTKDAVDYYNYSTDTLALINNIIYFANGSDANHLTSMNSADKIAKKINDHNVHDILAAGDTLFYVSVLDEHKNQKRLYSYNTSTTASNLITEDTVGKYLLNGDFILYQNVSDNSALYSIKTDGTQRTKLTDYSVESFAPFENQLLIINLSDNNNLYVLDPLTQKSKRLALMNGENLKVYNNKLYFINLYKNNALYTLTVDLAKPEVSASSILAEGINDYYPTDAGIFIEKRINVNNTYIVPLSK